MSEQQKRIEAWAVTRGSLAVICATMREVDRAQEIRRESDFEEAEVRRLVELREGESIVGPEERAVIEAAIKLNWLNTKHEAANARVLGAKTPSEVSEAIDDRHALIKMRPKIEAEFASAVGALKKAERNG